MKRLIATLATLLCAAALTAGPALAESSPAPAWTIAVVPYPTAFAAGSAAGSEEKGPAYQVEVFNVGGKATEGEFKIVDTLPGPLKPLAGFPPRGVYGPESTSEKVLRMSCSVAGHTVTCTGGQVTPLGPGEQAGVSIPVEVEASAPSQTLDKALVEGGGATTLATSQPTKISAEASPFGFLGGLFGSVTNADGSASTQAGSHPYQATVAGFYLNSNADAPDIDDLLAPGGGLHEIVVGLPRGEVVNPQATPHCTESQLYDLAAGSCPENTQVGTIALTLGLVGGFGESAPLRPLYNMISPPGHPAEFAFEVLEGIYVHLLGSVSADGSYQLSSTSSDISAVKEIGGVRAVLWGDPSAESHDAQRGECILPSRKRSLCPLEQRSHKAFLTMPSSCEGPITTTAQIDDWIEPGNFIAKSYESTDLQGHKVSIEGCNALLFEPTIEANATTSQAESPSGLEFDLHQTQHENYEELATADLKDATVTLPEGMTLNPSAANGREACSSAQLGVTTAAGQTPIRYREEPAHCPEASKLGTAEVLTPLLGHALHGSVYLAQPFDNPFGSLLGIYLVVEDEETGIIAKLAGKVTPDPATGRLSTTFEESPELPLEDVRLDLDEGPRGALTTPLTCGTKTTISTLTPWSTPEGADASPTGSFVIAAAAGGGNCPQGEAQAPNAPTFSGGTVSSQAGAFSPFVLNLARADGSQRLGSIDTTLPEGLLGKLAGVPYCSDAQIAAAESRRNPNEGAVEQASPSCPASSEVGTVTIGAGSGSSPIYVQGTVYLAGPYKNAPLSLVIITPAIAGPFDLGTVVVRVALQIDPNTAQISAVSDPLPTILDGIPLDVRSISLNMSRAGFTFNPTSCEGMSVAGQEISTLGQTAALSSRFQVGGCQGLAFKPSLTASTVGKASKAVGASLTVKVAQKPGEANIHKVALTLPAALPARLTTLQKACTEAQFNTNPAGCPAGSFIGTAKAVTPILSVPLLGPAIIVSHGGAAFPDVEFLLQANERGSVIQIDLDGKTDIKKGVTYSRFETVPDAPITSFETNLSQGPHSILGTNLPESAKYSLCGQKLTIPTTVTGQNGVRTTKTTPIGVTGCSTALSFTHKVKQKTLTLTVYAPAAGKITATGKGLTAKTKTAKGQEHLTITLKQRNAGKQHTTVRVTFTPSTGKDRKKQTKTTKLRFKQ